MSTGKATMSLPSTTLTTSTASSKRPSSIRNRSWSANRRRAGWVFSMARRAGIAGLRSTLTPSAATRTSRASATLTGTGRTNGRTGVTGATVASRTTKPSSRTGLLSCSPPVPPRRKLHHDSSGLADRGVKFLSPGGAGPPSQTAAGSANRSPAHPQGRRGGFPPPSPWPFRSGS